MSGSTLPLDVVEFLGQPNHAVLAWIGADQQPRSVATWYDWDDGRILLNMDVGRRRLRWLDVGVPLALTVLGAEDWYVHASLYGRLAERSDDSDLTAIDRLALRYTGKPYTDRSSGRVSIWMTVESWHGWNHGEPW